MIYKRFTEKAAEEWRQIYKVSPAYYPPTHDLERKLQKTD